MWTHFVSTAFECDLGCEVPRNFRRLVRVTLPIWEVLGGMWYVYDACSCYHLRLK